MRADVVGLGNGDRISGKFVAFENQNLRFQTAYKETLSIPRADIVFISIDDIATVVFTNKSRAEGRVVVDQSGAMRLVGDGAGAKPLLDLNGVDAIYPGRDSIPPAFRWSGRINLGFKTESGNTETEELNLDGRVRGRSKTHRLTADAEASFESANDVTNTEDASGSFTHDKFVSKKLFFFTRLSAEYDRFKDLDLRTFLATGPGYQIFEEEDLKLWLSGGIGWLHEDFKGEAEDRDDPALTWYYEYEQFFFDRFVQLFHDHSGAWNMSNTDEAVLNFRLGLRFPMRWGFVATTRLDIDHETEPAPGKDKTDTAFIITMGFEW